MNLGMQAKKSVGSSLVALLLAAGTVFPAVSEASPIAAAPSVNAQTTPLRISVTDTVTGLPLEDVRIMLYWADTAVNRANGRIPGQAVPAFSTSLPEKGSAPWTSLETGSYERLIAAGGEYVIVGEKEGYLPYSSRTQSGGAAAGSDKAASDGILRAAGNEPVAYAFSLTPAQHKYPAYMKGYTDGTFRPEQSIIRAELAVILQRSLSEETVPANHSFHDIASGKWLTAGVSLAAEKGWMQGTGGSRFEPERVVTRAEMAQILANVYGWPTESESVFNDTKGHWASEAIAAAASRGLLGGYPDGSFRPEQPVTRAETAVLINRMIDRPADAGLPMTWSDVPPSYWAYGEVMAASIDHTPSRVR